MNKYLDEEKEKYNKYYESALQNVATCKDELVSTLTEEQLDLLDKFQSHYRSLCECRQRVYDIENYEQGFGFLKYISTDE